MQYEMSLVVLLIHSLRGDVLELTSLRYSLRNVILQGATYIEQYHACEE